MTQHRITRRVVLVAALTVAAALTAGPVAAGGNVKVGGLLEPDTQGVCVDDPASLGTYTVSGDLTGCWYVDELTITSESAAGGFRAMGREQFVGCLHSTTCGRFFTEYTFTAKVVDGTETHGRCHHPIVGGEGGFEGVSGVISMHDLPNGCAWYTGHLSF
jgi:hypothetical protein